MKYAIAIEKYGLPCVEICNGETPFPEGAVWPVTIETIGDDMIIEGGILRKKTAEEKETFTTAKETDMQTSKSDRLKQAENDFLSLCDYLSGGTSHTKLTREELKPLIFAIADPQTKAEKAIELLDIVEECERCGGSDWFETCIWHV